MKNMAKIMGVLLLLLTVTGCSKDENMANRVSNGNNVDKVISELIDKTESENNSIDLEGEASIKSKDDSEKQDQIPQKSDDVTMDVDYDLTKMSSDMVYAMVFQLMVEPDAYVGKTFRMKGKYYPVYYESTAKYYHYCLVEDALACCAQGIEFVWGDGSHVYPDEYPEEKASIVVQGILETYREDGNDDYLYCRLKDATLEVINK
ncbi:hypothetical protein [Lutispora thermophila]|uniref:Lipoprotein n=1 Tax=Lutispora thermophila DSM 19022 TaxID=1122184 RepID=A0A1M6J332_9FIRM|nr:hypothetical protein [Lutispora thermophila]SHJ41088.1 hypothetical protein SAMN02745176_03486 [Lutispora thermophila DSM 19022]